MVHWYQRKRYGIVLRAGGLALVGIAWSLATFIAGIVHHQPGAAVTPLELIAGMLCFLCASAGLAFTVLGPHMFDPVRLPDRWAGISARTEVPETRP